MDCKKMTFPKIMNIVYFAFDILNVTKFGYLALILFAIVDAFSDEPLTNLQTAGALLWVAYMVLILLLLIVSFILVWIKSNKFFLIVSGIDIIVYSACLIYVESFRFGENAALNILLLAIQFILFLILVICCVKSRKTKEINAQD